MPWALSVIIDLELFLYPELNNQNLPSVIDNLFLPRKGIDYREKKGLDMSAIGFKENQEWHSTTLGWENAGTDDMHFARFKVQSRASFNQPFVRKVGDIDFNLYTDDISEGFKMVILFY